MANTLIASTARAVQLRSSRPVRTYLRTKPLWVHFRSLQSEGFSRAFRRWLLWSKILKTRPVATIPIHADAPVEVHLLTYERDYLAALWALKSFYHFSGVRYPLVIHFQGKVSRRALGRLRSHFPAAEIIIQPEADAVVEEWLEQRGLVRVLAHRRVNAMMLKLVDFVLVGRGINVLALDSDVLFFRCPSDLLITSETPLQMTFFQHDHASSYNITEEQALRELGIDLVPRLNAGLRLFARSSLDLTCCERFLGHPDVARPTGLLDQTLHALCASQQGRAAYLPDTYLISLEADVDLDKFVARHYAGPSRTLLSEEGLPRLIQMGFLDQ